MFPVFRRLARCNCVFNVAPFAPSTLTTPMNIHGVPRDEPPGAKVSAASISVYGKAIRTLRAFTNATVNKEPKWRHLEQN